MKRYTCIDKIRDASNNVKKFVLQDLETEKVDVVDKDKVKLAISNKEIVVKNLRIDNNGRLVDYVEPTHPAQNDKCNTETIIRKIYVGLKQLYDSFKSLEGLCNAKDNKILNFMNHIISRNNTADIKINQILHRLQELEQSNSEPPALTNQINDIHNYLIENADDLEQIKDSISELSNQLQNLSGIENAENRKFLTEDGQFEMPDDLYSKFWYEKYFESVNTSNISFENEVVLNELKKEMEKSYRAYTDTEELYINQLADYAEKGKDPQILSGILGVLHDKFEAAVGLPAELVGNFTREIGYELTANIPGMENSVRDRKAVKDFSNREEISIIKAKRIRAEVGGIWNHAIEFIKGNPEWEIMLYVIQTLNHYNLHTFSVNKRYEHRAVQSNNGQMNTYGDNTFFDKYAKKLSEDSLHIIYKELYNGSKVQDKRYECEKMIYDRFIVSYFAAKKVLYRHNMYPFGSNATPETNGLLVKLLEIALKISNVQDGIINRYIGSFCNSNNHKAEYKYHIDTNVDLSSRL